MWSTVRQRRFPIRSRKNVELLNRSNLISKACLREVSYRGRLQQTGVLTQCSMRRCLICCESFSSKVAGVLGAYRKLPVNKFSFTVLLFQVFCFFTFKSSLETLYFCTPLIVLWIYWKMAIVASCGCKLAPGQNGKSKNAHCSTISHAGDEVIVQLIYLISSQFKI